MGRRVFLIFLVTFLTLLFFLVLVRLVDSRNRLVDSWTVVSNVLCGCLNLRKYSNVLFFISAANHVILELRNWIHNSPTIAGSASLHRIDRIDWMAIR